MPVKQKWKTVHDRGNEFGTVGFKEVTTLCHFCPDFVFVGTKDEGHKKHNGHMFYKHRKEYLVAREKKSKQARNIRPTLHRTNKYTLRIDGKK